MLFFKAKKGHGGPRSGAKCRRRIAKWAGALLTTSSLGPSPQAHVMAPIELDVSSPISVCHSQVLMDDVESFIRQTLEAGPEPLGESPIVSCQRLQQS
jgi:hypothetical protein